MRKRHLFCTSSHHNVLYKKQEFTKGCLEISVPARECAQLLKMLYIHTHMTVPHGENIEKTVLYIYKLVLTMSRAKWIKEISPMVKGPTHLSLPPCR